MSFAVREMAKSAIEASSMEDAIIKAIAISKGGRYAQLERDGVPLKIYFDGREEAVVTEREED